MANEAHKSPFGPDHTGKHATVATHPGMTVSHASHGVVAGDPARHGDKPNIARDAGRGKNVNPTPVHGGMISRSRDTGIFHMGADALSRADANPSNPFGAPPAGKVLTPVKATPGMRNRTTSDALHGDQPGASHARGAARGLGDNAELGRQILHEAACAAAPDDRMALPHWRK
jgi:hypothetical protein